MATPALQHSIEQLRQDVRNVRSVTRLRAMDPSDQYGYADLMGDLSSVAKNMVAGVYEIESDRLYGTTHVPGFAIFLYGSPARGEMTSYSDIDLHVIDEDRDERSAELKRRILDSLVTFGFGKIDDPNWENLDTVELYVARSITEGNQILDAAYVCGDTVVADKVNQLKARYDTLDRNIRNIVFQRFYLDHYYSRRSTPEVPNVKYGCGGYRELLTFDWFDKTMGLYDHSWTSATDGTLVVGALANLLKECLVTEEQLQRIDRSVGFVTLLRNEMLHVNQGTKDQGITHLDGPTNMRLWDSSPRYFTQHGAAGPDDISSLFEEHRSVVRWTKDLMWHRLLAQETMRKGPSWRAEYDETVDAGTPTFRRDILAKSSDPLIQIVSVWAANALGNKEYFAHLSRTFMQSEQRCAMDGSRQDFNWEVLASLACSPLCPPDVLHAIGTDSARQIGLGYILRIIGRNPNTGRETLVDIAEDTSLDDRYRKVARLNLEKGLHIATTRAS